MHSKVLLFSEKGLSFFSWTLKVW